MTQSKEKFDYKEWAKKTGYFKKYYAEHKCDYQEEHILTRSQLQI